MMHPSVERRIVEIKNTKIIFIEFLQLISQRESSDITCIGFKLSQRSGRLCEFFKKLTEWGRINSLQTFNREKFFCLGGSMAQKWLEI
jgi:hypothetical protein